MYLFDEKSLSTIHFYIILKPGIKFNIMDISLSTIHFYIILKQGLTSEKKVLRFEYHTFLHHSQTSNLKLENEMPS